MARSRRYELGVGILLAASLALLAWMSIKVGAVSSWQPQVRVELEMVDAAGIDAGAAVSVAGVQVGRVETMRLVHDRAIAELSLDREASLRRDVGVRIRARSVLGEKYIELTPDRADAPVLEDGDRLVLERPQTEIDEMVDAVGPLLAALDAEALGRALSRVTEALDDDPERLTRLLADLETLVARGADAAEALPALIEHADATLDRADGALSTLQARAAEARSPLRRADALLAELDAMADPVPGTLEEVRSAVAEARAILQEVDGLSTDAATVLDNLTEIDKWELRRLLREEGILIRVRPHEVVVEEDDGDDATE